MLVPHLVGHFAVLPHVMTLVPGNSWYIGLFVASGVYVLGPSGFLAGPLVACITKAALDLARRYNEERERQDEELRGCGRACPAWRA